MNFITCHILMLIIFVFYWIYFYCNEDLAYMITGAMQQASIIWGLVSLFLIFANRKQIKDVINGKPGKLNKKNKGVKCGNT